jgi:disease resistance protein RPM1
MFTCISLFPNCISCRRTLDITSSQSYKYRGYKRKIKDKGSSGSEVKEFHAIEHMRLIRLWMAEGFVNGEDGKTLEAIAGRYLKELLSRSLLQVAEKTGDGRMNMCRMRDLLREIVNSKSRDHNFATITKEQNSVKHFSIHELCSSTGVKLLNVLDLQDAPLEAFPVEIVNLYFLKHLSLKNT